MSHCTVEIDRRTAGVIIRITGEADNACAADVQQGIRQLQVESDRNVVIDLRDLRYIASMTLAEIINLRQQLQQRGGRMVLAGARDSVADVLKKTRLAELFPVHDDPEAALIAEPDAPSS